MKPTKVKAWPELVDFIPALPTVTDTRRGATSVEAPVEVDFGSVRRVNATGLTVFLLQLLRLVGHNRTLQMRAGSDPSVRNMLRRLGAFDLLIAMAASFQPELADEEESEPAGSSDPVTPIYRLNFGAAAERRDAVRSFVTWLTTHLHGTLGDHYQHVHGLVMLLHEIAKNSADHSQEDALFGMEFSQVDATNFRFAFVFGDLGIGIKQNIEKHLPPEDIRPGKGTVYEAYRLALKPGFTTNRDSVVNKGHGMSIIIDSATVLGVRLSVFDAWSRGVLDRISDSQWPSHQAIRRAFHIVGHDVGFFYHGEMILSRSDAK